jgi:hypothetical protein
MENNIRSIFINELSASFMEYCNDEERRKQQAIKYLEKAKEIDRIRFESWCGSFFAFIR